MRRQRNHSTVARLPTADNQWSEHANKTEIIDIVAKTHDKPIRIFILLRHFKKIQKNEI